MGPSELVALVLADRIPDAGVELYAVGLPVVPGTRRPARASVAAARSGRQA
ncbi:hypothetical protein OIE52_24660 [Streptomyces canus]|uniref:hypothetical protein n=1 Tax=Streptomyces canus TaxID=58343 RepID=UPI0030E3D96E